MPLGKVIPDGNCSSASKMDRISKVSVIEKLQLSLSIFKDEDDQHEKNTGFVFINLTNHEEKIKTKRFQISESTLIRPIRL